MSSDRSIRSRVSFDSTRSRGSQRTIRSDLGYESDDGYSTGINDPSFGITNGVGPTGEPVEMIGLGRKKPKHRVFQANMLKPALRSPTKLASRRTVDETNSGASWSERSDKPSPSRPMSYVGPVMGSFSSLRDGIRSNTGTRSCYPSHEPMQEVLLNLPVTTLCRSDTRNRHLSLPPNQSTSTSDDRGRSSKFSLVSQHLSSSSGLPPVISLPSRLPRAIHTCSGQHAHHLLGPVRYMSQQYEKDE
ncbi:hypothetical protein C347_05241 [Cryptococcus neoformans AD2-60a]|nr:hypothetical protein C347_05241 [Cryptococcus neoformans var. grubii AD2-60a]